MEPASQFAPAMRFFYEAELPEHQVQFLEDNARFFVDVLSGRDEPAGTPMGAKAYGPVGVDTDLVRTSPTNQVTE